MEPGKMMFVMLLHPIKASVSMNLMVDGKITVSRFTRPAKAPDPMEVIPSPMDNVVIFVL